MLTNLIQIKNKKIKKQKIKNALGSSVFQELKKKKKYNNSIKNNF